MCRSKLRVGRFRFAPGPARPLQVGTYVCVISRDCTLRAHSESPTSAACARGAHRRKGYTGPFQSPRSLGGPSSVSHVSPPQHHCDPCRTTCSSFETCASHAVASLCKRVKTRLSCRSSGTRIRLLPGRSLLGLLGCASGHRARHGGLEYKRHSLERGRRVNARTQRRTGSGHTLSSAVRCQDFTLIDGIACGTAPEVLPTLSAHRNGRDSASGTDQAEARQGIGSGGWVGPICGYPLLPELAASRGQLDDVAPLRFHRLRPVDHSENRPILRHTVSEYGS